MMDKYYQLKIEDMHVGLEVYVKHTSSESDDVKYIPAVVTPETDWRNFFSITYGKEGSDIVIDAVEDADTCFYLKYLTQADVESLGFEVIKDHRNWLILKGKGKIKNCDMVHVEFHRSNPTMVSINNQLHYEDHFSWFEGKIKNKSELKKVLKMIGYEAD